MLKIFTNHTSGGLVPSFVSGSMSGFQPVALASTTILNHYNFKVGFIFPRASFFPYSFWFWIILAILACSFSHRNFRMGVYRSQNLQRLNTFMILNFPFKNRIGRSSTSFIFLVEFWNFIHVGLALSFLLLFLFLDVLSLSFYCKWDISSQYIFSTDE